MNETVSNRRARRFFGAGTVLLLLSFVSHSIGHFAFYVNEASFNPERTKLAAAMKSYIADRVFFDTSMWTILKMFSMSFSFLMLFAGVSNLIVLKSEVGNGFFKRISLFNTAFWGGACILYAVFNPAIQPLLICIVIFVLFGFAFLSSKKTAGA